MMAFVKEYGLGLGALAVYVLGGVGVFGGIGLIALLGEENLGGWGEGRTIGYLLICTGAALSILGVLLMRLFRNHLPLPPAGVGR
jgi:hypothetical protein